MSALRSWKLGQIALTRLGCKASEQPDRGPFWDRKGMRCKLGLLSVKRGFFFYQRAIITQIKGLPFSACEYLYLAFPDRVCRGHTLYIGLSQIFGDGTA